jgi:hypothetical protein
VVWSFAAIAVLLLFASPRIRSIGLTILGSVFVIFLVIVLLNRRPVAPTPVSIAPMVNAGAAARQFDFDKYQEDKKDREDPEAKTRIALSAVRFGQVQFVTGIEAGTIESIRARLYNDSPQYTLTDFTYYLEVKDCLPVKADERHPVECTTVFDQRKAASTTVPPNQARDVMIEIAKDPATGNPPFRLLGTPQIELTPTATRAYVTPGRAAAGPHR